MREDTSPVSHVRVCVKHLDTFNEQFKKNIQDIYKYLYVMKKVLVVKSLSHHSVLCSDQTDVR